jgi:hypothetical protein
MGIKGLKWRRTHAIGRRSAQSSNAEILSPSPEAGTSPSGETDYRAWLSMSRVPNAEHRSLKDALTAPIPEERDLARDPDE